MTLAQHGSAILLPFCWDLQFSRLNTQSRTRIAHLLIDSGCASLGSLLYYRSKLYGYIEAERERERDRERERETERERERQREREGDVRRECWTSPIVDTIFNRKWLPTEAMAPLNVSVVPRPSFSRLGASFETFELSKNQRYQSHYRAAKCQGLFVILTYLDIESDQRRQGRCMLMMRCIRHLGLVFAPNWTMPNA